jgi:hypothetical protein
VDVDGSPIPVKGLGGDLRKRGLWRRGASFNAKSRAADNLPRAGLPIPLFGLTARLTLSKPTDGHRNPDH